MKSLNEELKLRERTSSIFWTVRTELRLCWRELYGIACGADVGVDSVVGPFAAVMGDIGKGLYVAEDVVPIYRQLLSLASIITPNQFETEYVPAIPRPWSHGMATRLTPVKPARADSCQRPRSIRSPRCTRR